MKAINIIWDVDFEEDLENLSTEIDIPNGMTDEEEISDYITDETGFCHKGFELVKDDIKDWEYDDAMHDYMQWKDELENLLNDEEQDEEEIERVKKIIADYEDALFEC
jgi:hypothetical protein